MIHKIVLRASPSPALVEVLCRLGTFRPVVRRSGVGEGPGCLSLYSECDGVELVLSEGFSLKGSGRIEMFEVDERPIVDNGDSIDGDGALVQGMRLKVSVVHFCKINTRTLG